MRGKDWIPHSALKNDNFLGEEVKFRLSSWWNVFQKGQGRVRGVKARGVKGLVGCIKTVRPDPQWSQCSHLLKRSSNEKGGRSCVEGWVVKHTFLDWNGRCLASSTENMYQFSDITQREDSVIDSTQSHSYNEPSAPISPHWFVTHTCSQTTDLDIRSHYLDHVICWLLSYLVISKRKYQLSQTRVVGGWGLGCSGL